MTGLRRALLAFVVVVLAGCGPFGRGPQAAPRAARTPAASATPLDSPTVEVSPTVASTPAPTATAVPAPARQAPVAGGGGVRWGVWEPRWQLPNGTVDFGQVTQVETEVAHHADLVHWFASWDEGWDSYDGGLVRQVAQSGRTPMITWEPTGRALGAISGGTFDAYLDSWARGMAASAAPTIYLRIFHEFNDPVANGAGYGWGVGGGTGNQPADLVAAWRHIHDRFAAAGARNVRFVWCPDGVNTGLSLLRAAYPGDAYVDFACWDTYDYDPGADYRTLSQVTQKPLLLAEVGARNPAWVRDLAARLSAGQLARIRAVVWFDDGEWRLDARPDVLAAARAMLAGSAFS
jgi:hypothetical protein